MDAAAVMRWLYRNALSAATSNKRPRPILRNFLAGNPVQRAMVDHFEHAVFSAHDARRIKPLQRLVGVHQRHAKRVHTREFPEAPVVEKPYQALLLLDAVLIALFLFAVAAISLPFMLNEFVMVVDEFPISSSRKILPTGRNAP